MDNPRISIIVPVYKVECYLRECLDSIRAQTFTDWECILVDDGSPDSCPAICDEYSSMDSRFKTIHKTNGGLSSARNAGIEMARGEFIGFIDSDDWIEPGMFQLLYDLITEYDADIAQIGYIKEFVGRHSVKHLVKTTKVISGKEAMHWVSFNKLPNFACNKLHRRKIMICGFPEGRNFEDIYVYGHWLKAVDRMVIDPSPMYHYRMRKGSIVHSDVAQNRYDFFLSCIESMDALEDSPDDKTSYHRKNAFIHKGAIHAAKLIARKESDRSRRDATIQRISKELKRFPLASLRYTGIKQWWRSKLLTKYPRYFTMLMRVVGFFDLDVKDRERRYYD